MAAAALAGDAADPRHLLGRAPGAERRRRGRSAQRRPVRGPGQGALKRLEARFHPSGGAPGSMGGLPLHRAYRPFGASGKAELLLVVCARRAPRGVPRRGVRGPTTRSRPRATIRGVAMKARMRGRPSSLSPPVAERPGSPYLGSAKALGPPPGAFSIGDSRYRSAYLGRGSRRRTGYSARGDRKSRLQADDNRPLRKEPQASTKWFPHKRRMAMSSDTPPTDRPEIDDDVQAHWQRVVGRRSFLVGVGIAGAAALPGGALLTSEAAAHSSKLTAGDIAILRFLAAAEEIESDLWTQYNELGGVNGGNPAYMAALENLDGDMPQYIADNTDDENSHVKFLNAYLRSQGA